MTIQRIGNVQGVYIDGTTGKTKTNFSTNNRINLHNEAGKIQRGLINFALPAAKGTDYDYGKLGIYNSRAIVGSKTLTLRVITSKWDISKVTYFTKPTTTETNKVSVTKVNAPADSLWEFDIQTILDTASAGQAWYGLELQIGGADTAYWYWHNHKGTPGLLPYLDVSWFIPPVAPINLSPANGLSASGAYPVLTFEFPDRSGLTSITGLQVRINTTPVFTGGLVYDSGELDTTYAIHDLAGTAFPGISAAQVLYWQVRIRGTDGSWSSYSTTATFTRTVKGTNSILSPAVAPDNIITDPTPELIWDASYVQRAFQVFLWDMTLSQLVHDSGKYTSTDEHYTIPNDVIKFIGHNYKALVRSWDNVSRVSTPGDPAAIDTEREFTFEYTDTEVPFTGITVTPDPFGRPWMIIDFTGATPDFVQVIRDGEFVYKNIDPADVIVSAGVFQYIDREATNLTDHVWEVARTVNGITSDNNPTDTGRTRAAEAWLCSSNGEFSVPFLNYTHNFVLGEESEVYDILNSEEAITVFQSQKGFAGDFSGLLSKAVGPLDSAQEYLEEVLTIRRRKGMKMILHYKDQSFPCVVSKINYDAVVSPEEIMYQVDFRAIQKSDLSMVEQP